MVGGGTLGGADGGALVGGRTASGNKPAPAGYGAAGGTSSPSRLASRSSSNGARLRREASYRRPASLGRHPGGDGAGPSPLQHLQSSESVDLINFRTPKGRDGGELLGGAGGRDGAAAAKGGGAWATGVGGGGGVSFSDGEGGVAEDPAWRGDSIADAASMAAAAAASGGGGSGTMHDRTGTWTSSRLGGSFQEFLPDADDDDSDVTADEASPGGGSGGVQGVSDYEYAQARQVSAELREEKVRQVAEWDTHHTVDGTPYYHHRGSGRVSWVPPTEQSAEELAAACQAALEMHQEEEATAMAAAGDAGGEEAAVGGASGGSHQRGQSNMSL